MVTSGCLRAVDRMVLHPDLRKHNVQEFLSLDEGRQGLEVGRHNNLLEISMSKVNWPLFWAAFVVLALIVALFATGAHARDNGNWDVNDPIVQWY